MTLAITGASGKTGWRVADEALRRGQSVRAILRPGSTLPAQLEGRVEVIRLALGDQKALSAALQGCEATVIATGARPRWISPDRSRWMPWRSAIRSPPAARPA